MRRWSWTRSRWASRAQEGECRTSRFGLNRTVFVSRVENAVQLVPTGTSVSNAPRVRLRNVDGATRTSGAEALIRYRRENVSLTGSYVFVQATEPSPTTSPGQAACGCAGGAAEGKLERLCERGESFERPANQVRSVDSQFPSAGRSMDCGCVGSRGWIRGERWRADSIRDVEGSLRMATTSDRASPETRRPPHRRRSPPPPLSW